MKRFCAIICCALPLLTTGAASFQNLDFSAANTNNVVYNLGVYSGSGNTADLLPGWQLYFGTTLQSSMLFDAFMPVGPGNAAILFGTDPKAGLAGLFPPEHKYALWLRADSFYGQPVSLVQRGDIPPDATFLRLRGNGFSLTLDGTPIPYTLGEGFDVSAFDGQNVELKLTTFFDGPFQGPVDDHFLDGIHFIPEPGAQALFVLAVSGLAIANLLHKRRTLR